MYRGSTFGGPGPFQTSVQNCWTTSCRCISMRVCFPVLNGMFTRSRVGKHQIVGWVNPSNPELWACNLRDDCEHVFLFVELATCLPPKFICIYEYIIYVYICPLWPSPILSVLVSTPLYESGEWTSENGHDNHFAAGDWCPVTGSWSDPFMEWIPHWWAHR